MYISTFIYVYIYIYAYNIYVSVYIYICFKQTNFDSRCFPTRSVPQWQPNYRRCDIKPCMPLSNKKAPEIL